MVWMHQWLLVLPGGAQFAPFAPFAPLIQLPSCSGFSLHLGQPLRQTFLQLPIWQKCYDDDDDDDDDGDDDGDDDDGDGGQPDGVSLHPSQPLQPPRQTFSSFQSGSTFGSSLQISPGVTPYPLVDAFSMQNEFR